ncbi:hypothetical protein GOODEAATRI_027344, partial [Goodea atripinnis]
MSGDTLAWKGASPRQSSTDPSHETEFTGGGGPVKILKVCFCTNNNLGKNFKLVKCDSSWKIEAIIRSILVSGRLGPNVELSKCYGLMYDLRIRYIPVNFLEKFKKDRSTFLYFYQQVRSDYMQSHASKVSDGMALQLGCLEI